MPTKSAKNNQHRIYLRKVRKLQRAGLLGKVNQRRRGTPYIYGLFTKYRDVLTGRAAAIKAPSQDDARELENRLGVKRHGRVVLIPREAGEKVRITKEGEIKSTRKRYGQTIRKTIGAPVAPPDDDVKRYYTIPHRKRGTARLKRHTFASFDELLFYLSKYEIEFEDIEDYIEVEEVAKGSDKQRSKDKKIARERKAGVKRAKRRRARKTTKFKRASRGH